MIPIVAVLTILIEEYDKSTASLLPGFTNAGLMWLDDGYSSDSAYVNRFSWPRRLFTVVEILQGTIVYWMILEYARARWILPHNLLFCYNDSV